jgi:hypothetical protein
MTRPERETLARRWDRFNGALADLAILRPHLSDAEC